MQIIEEVDQHAQPGVIAPIERENQPRQFRRTAGSSRSTARVVLLRRTVPCS